MIRRGLFPAALMALGVAACTPHVNPPGGLTPLSARMTDEAIRADLERLNRAGARLNALRSDGSAAVEYSVVKSRAWLALAQTEYTDNDATGLADYAFRESVRLAETVRANTATTTSSDSAVPGSRMVREDLWATATELKRHEWFVCAAGLVAMLEVRLVWAGNEDRTIGAADGGWHEAAAEALAAEARSAADGCIPEPEPEPEPVPEREPEPEPEPVLPQPVSLTLPDRVHFAENSSVLGAESRSVLDAVAAALELYEDVTVRFTGQIEFLGDSDENERAARARMSSVIQYLVSRGIARERLQMGGMLEAVNPMEGLPSGRRRLRVAAWPELDRARERRVEIAYRSPEHISIQSQIQERDLQRNR